MRCIFTCMLLVAAAVAEPIINLVPACPATQTGKAVISLVVDVPAYARAKCENGEQFLQKISDMEYALNGTFRDDPEDCQFQKLTGGANTFRLEIEIGWGTSSDTEVNQVYNTETHVVSCSFDHHGMGVSENSSVIRPYLAPKETQRLMGIPHPRALFEVRLLDILDRDITNTSISLGKKVRLKVMETNTSTSFVCPAGYDQVNGRCYYVSEHVGVYSTADADKFCASVGGEPVALETKEEFAALRHFFITHGVSASFITSGMIIGHSMAFWTTTGVPVIGDGDCWMPGHSLATALDECILLDFLFGQIGLRDSSCREKSGRSLLCELPEPAQADDSEVVHHFQALSCEARNSFTSYSVLRAGCGDGNVFRKSAGFVTEGKVVYSPYFEAFRLQGETSLFFSCNFTVCETSCNGDSCPVGARKKRFSGDLVISGRFISAQSPDKKDKMLMVGDSPLHKSVRKGPLVTRGRRLTRWARFHRRKTLGNGF